MIFLRSVWVRGANKAKAVAAIAIAIDCNDCDKRVSVIITATVFLFVPHCCCCLPSAPVGLTRAEAAAREEAY